MPNNTLLRKNKVRDYALETAKANRSHKFTRVSGSFYFKVDAYVKQFIAQEILRLPSKGKTIQ